MNYTLLHKTFSSSLFKDTSALEKYVLSSNLYAKYYIKVVDATEIYDKQIKLYTLDNTFNIFNIAFNRRRKKKVKRFNLKVGSSLALNFFKFRNRFSEHWSFKSLLSTRKVRTMFGTKRMFMFLKSKNLKKFYSFFFLRPIKGGFLVYSKGSICFMPKSQLKYALKYFLKSLQPKKMYRKVRILYKLLPKIKSHLLVPIRLPYAILQMSFRRMGRIRYNFGLSRKKKRWRQHSKFRLVVVYKERRKWTKKKKGSIPRERLAPILQQPFIIHYSIPADLGYKLDDLDGNYENVGRPSLVWGESPLDIRKSLSPNLKPLSLRSQKIKKSEEEIRVKCDMVKTRRKVNNLLKDGSCGLKNPKYKWLVVEIYKRLAEKWHPFLEFVFIEWLKGLGHRSISRKKRGAIQVFICKFAWDFIIADLEKWISSRSSLERKLIRLIFEIIYLGIEIAALEFPGEPDVPYLDEDRDRKILINPKCYYHSIAKKWGEQ